MNNQSQPTRGTNGHNGAPGHTEVDESPTSVKLISQFFIFPLIIVAVGVSIFIIFGLIGNDSKSPREYIRELRMNNGMFQGNRRWQAAVELSSILARNKDPKLAREIAPDLIHLFTNSQNDDPRVRRYMALALGRLGDPQAVPALVQATRDVDSETRVYAIYALGELRAKESVPDLVALYETDDTGLRKIIVYVLGVLEDARALPVLKLALTDRQEDVQWNAATSLARLNDPSGVPTLQHMLDRGYLNSVKDMREDQKEEAMINAIRALSLLKDRSSEPLLRTISQRDPSLKVRNAAYEALRTVSS